MWDVALALVAYTNDIYIIILQRGIAMQNTY